MKISKKKGRTKNKLSISTAMKTVVFRWNYVNINESILILTNIHYWILIRGFPDGLHLWKPSDLMRLNSKNINKRY